ncbi:hypothetical protein BRIN106911_07950 [Brevibacillus invocatus]
MQDESSIMYRPYKKQRPESWLMSTSFTNTDGIFCAASQMASKKTTWTTCLISNALSWL